MKDTRILSKGDKVRVSNPNLTSYDAVGVIVAPYFSNAKVELTDNIPVRWTGGKTVTYSYDSLSKMKKELNNSGKTNIAVFFESRDDAVEFMKTGNVCSEDTETFDIVLAENLRDCDLFLEKLENDVVSDIESLVFKGVLYDVKSVISFVEAKSEDDL